MPPAPSQQQISAASLPADHLSHPENWATGGDPATAKQKAFVATLARQQHADLGRDDAHALGKSEASELIEKLKDGDVAGAEEVVQGGGRTTGGEKRAIGDVDDNEKADGADKSSSGEDGADPKKDDEVDDDGDASDGKAPPSKKPRVDAKSGKKPSSPSTTPSKTSTTASEDSSSSANKASSTVAGDGVTIDPEAKTSTGAPAVTERDGSPRLHHPENWQTGDDPATDKQLAYLAVLEKQKHAQPTAEEKAGELGKSAASEQIERLKDA